MAAAVYYSRFLETSLAEAVSDTPVVLIHGPRQCGKTTLAQAFGKKEGYDYFSFDDDVAAAAEAGNGGALHSRHRAIRRGDERRVR